MRKRLPGRRVQRVGWTSQSNCLVSLASTGLDWQGLPKNVVGTPSMNFWSTSMPTWPPSSSTWASANTEPGREAIRSPIVASRFSISAAAR